MSEVKQITDGHGRVLGKIITKSNGSKELWDANGNILGHEDADGRVRDSHGCDRGHNCLASLLRD